MPVTEQQLSTLSPEDASAVRYYQSRFGDEAAMEVYERMASAFSGQEQPAQTIYQPVAEQTLSARRRAEPTSAELSRAGTAARLAEFQRTGDADASVQRVQEIIEAPRTVRGERVGDRTVQPGELETATPWEAARLSFFPQPLVTPEGAEAAKKRKAEKRKTAADVEAQLRKEASQAAGAVYQPGQNRKALENQQYQRQVKSHLDEARGRLRRNARNFYYDTEGNEAAPQGSARRAEQDAEIQGIADELYLEYRSDVFGDLEPVLDEALPERTRSQRVLRWAAGMLSEETAEGIPYETPLAAGMRDIGMLIRPLTKPFIDAISYEVDEEGKPLDESDINYQMYQLQEEALQKIQAGEGDIGDYAAAWTGFLPTAMLARRTHGARGEVTTGNYGRDMAISGARGRFLGDDIVGLSAARRLYVEGMGLPEWSLMVAGGVMELGLPLTPAPVIAPAAKVALRSTGAGMKFVASGAELAGAFGKGPAKVARAVGKAAEDVADPIGAAQKRLLVEKGRAIQEGMDGAAGDLSAVKPQTVLDDVATILADDLADTIVAGRAYKPAKTTGIGRAKNVAAAEEKAGNLVTVIKAVDNRIQDALTGVRGAGGKISAARVERAMRDRLVGDRQGQEILNAINRNALAYTGKDLHRAVLADIAKPIFKEELANVVPNDWIRVTPITIVSKRGFDELSDKVAEITKPLLQRAKTTGGMTWLANGPKVASMLVKNIGVQKIVKTERLTNIVRDLKRGKPISEADYNYASHFIVDEVWKTETAASVTLKGAGEPFKRSSEVVARRLSTVQNTRELLRAARTFFEKAAPVELGITAKPASLEIAVELDNIAQALVDVPDRMIRRLAKLAEENGPEAGLNKFLEEITSKTLIEFEEGATAAAKKAARDTSDVSDLESITRIFFTMEKSGWYWENTNKFRVALEEAGITTVTTDNVLAAIELARKLQGSELIGSGLARTAPTRIGGIPIPLTATAKSLMRVGYEDDPVAAIMTWATDQTRKATIASKEKDWYSRSPELFFGFGKRKMDHSNFTEALKSAGIPEKVAGSVTKHAADLTPSNRTEVFEQVLISMWDSGKLDVQAANAQLAKAIADPARITKLLLDLDGTRKTLVRHIVDDLGIPETDPLFAAKLDSMAQDVSSKLFEVLTEMNTDKLVGQLGMLGVGLSSDVPLKTMYAPVVLKTSTKRALLVDPETAALATRLYEDTASGKMQESLAALRRRDMKVGEWTKSMVSGALNTIRRTTISGFLGGFPLPATRFLGLNVTSAPFIAAITSPGYVWAAVKAIPDGAIGRLAKVARDANVPGTQKASSFLRQKMMAQPDDVVFTTRFGRQYTKREFDKLVDEKNVRFSQVTFEFRDAIVDEMMRAARISADGSPVGSLQSVARWMDPRKKNLWNKVTEESDMAFRESVFREALIRGENPEVAADLARNALLDYGAISPWVRKNLSMFTLFYAFPIKNTQEVAKAFVRAPGAVRNLRRIMLITQQQHREMGTWAYEDDWHRNRLWVRYGEEFDGISSRLYGPSIPAITGFETLINGFSIATSNDRSWEKARKYAVDSFIQNPALSLLRDQLELDKRKEGPLFMYDPQHVVFLQSVGLWGVSREFFGIETVLADKMRAGEPEFTEDGKSVQYQFKDKKSASKWRTFKWIGVVTSIDRNIRDYTAELVRLGVVGDDADLKRHSDGKWYLHAAALETPMKVSDEIDMKLRQRRQILEELRALLQ